MQDSIFTKIIKGEIPCHKIYEDEKTLAFLDIHPIHPGQIVLVPKKQIPFLWDLDDDDYHYLWSVAKHIGQHVRDILKPPRVGVVVEGFEVEHVHIKIIPLYAGSDIRMHVNMEADPDHTALAKTAELLKL